MNEPIFWIWNGWGILFTIAYSLHIIAYIGVINKFGATPLRVPIAIFGWICVLMVFIMSGWVAGIISIPFGVLTGPSLARILLPQKY